MEVQVLPDGELPVERVRLRDDADQLLGGRGVPDHVDAGDEGPSRRRDDPGREHPGRRRLPGAVRAQEAEDLALVDREVQVVDGAEVGAGVDLGEVDRADDPVGVLGVVGPGRGPVAGHGHGTVPGGGVSCGLAFIAVSLRT